VNTNITPTLNVPTDSQDLNRRDYGEKSATLAVTHNQIEPFVTFAWWEGDNAGMVFSPNHSDTSAASALKMPLNKVHI
jgi:hypothetical protein